MRAKYRKTHHKKRLRISQALDAAKARSKNGGPVRGLRFLGEAAKNKETIFMIFFFLQLH